MPTSQAWITKPLTLRTQVRHHDSRSSGIVSPRHACGFTFIEVLIALAILVILASVVLNSHVGIIRAENRVRSIEESRLIAERIAGEVWLSTSAMELVGSDIEGWNVRFEPAITTENSTNQLTWNRWTISPSNDPAMTTVLYLRPPPAKTNATTGKTRTGGPLSFTPRQDSVQRPASSRPNR